MKKLKDYLHFYLQSEIKVLITKCSYTMVHEHNYSNGDTRQISTTTYKWFQLDNCLLKPILRPLEKIERNEVIHFFKLKGIECSSGVFRTGVDGWFLQMEYNNANKELQNDWQDIRFMNALQFAYLTKQGFDVFGLIDCGLALNHSIIEGGEEKIK